MLVNNFDIYIGGIDKILNACFERIIPGDKDRTKEFSDLMRKFKFRISDGSKLKFIPGGIIYRYYFGAYDKNNKLVFYNPNKKHKGRFMEFLADNYDFEPVSVISKISFHDKNSHNFDIAYSPKANLRLIGYIVLTKDIQSLYKQLKACDLIKVKNVFYTTPERLIKMSLPRALMTFSEDGTVYTCPNFYFEPSIKEGTISSFDKNGLIDSV